MIRHCNLTIAIDAEESVTLEELLKGLEHKMPGMPIAGTFKKPTAIVDDISDLEWLGEADADGK